MYTFSEFACPYERLSPNYCQNKYIKYAFHSILLHRQRHGHSRNNFFMNASCCAPVLFSTHDIVYMQTHKIMTPQPQPVWLLPLTPKMFSTARLQHIFLNMSQNISFKFISYADLCGTTAV